MISGYILWRGCKYWKMIRGGQKSNHDLIWFEWNFGPFDLIWRIFLITLFDLIWRLFKITWFDLIWRPFSMILFYLNLRKHYRSIAWLKSWIRAKPMAPMERVCWELSIGAIFAYETSIPTSFRLDFVTPEILIWLDSTPLNSSMIWLDLRSLFCDFICFDLRLLACLCGGVLSGVFSISSVLWCHRFGVAGSGPKKVVKRCLIWSIVWFRNRFTG